MAWTFPPAAESARAARRWAEPHLQALQSDEASSDALMVLSELVTNAITHGSGPVRVNLEPGDGVVRLEVSDAGRQIPRTLPYDPEAIGGRGLRIVGRIAPRWGIRDDADGKTVWAEVPL